MPYKEKFSCADCTYLYILRSHNFFGSAVGRVYLTCQTCATIPPDGFHSGQTTLIYTSSNNDVIKGRAFASLLVYDYGAGHITKQQFFIAVLTVLKSQNEKAKKYILNALPAYSPTYLASSDIISLLINATELQDQWSVFLPLMNRVASCKWAAALQNKQSLETP